MPVGPYFADFLSRTAKLAVELDGFSHDLRAEQDAVCDRFFTAQGYRVLRFTNAEVFEHLEGVVTAIREALNETPD